MKIKKGDKVIVRAGKDKGKEGVVLTTIASTGRVVVEGVNLKTHHVKAKSETEKGQRVVKPASMSASNVAVVDPKTGKPARVGYKVESGKSVRVSKQSGASL